MAFLDTLGIGAAALFGIGVGARAFSPIIAPAIGKLASGGFKAASFAARKIAWPIAKGFGGGGIKALPGLTSFTAKTAYSAVKFAAHHPYITAGAVGAGAYLATQTSPYESPTMSGSLEGINLSSSFNQEQMAAESLNESGIAPMGGITSGAAVRNQRLMESTMGLTQGLWKSRH
jgi:hypothetical protein